MKESLSKHYLPPWAKNVDIYLICVLFSRKLTLKATIYPGNAFSWKHSSSIMFRLLKWKYSPLEFGLQIPRPTPHHSFTIMFSWSRISKGKISCSFQEKGVCQTSNTADRVKTRHSWDVHRVWLSHLFINIPPKFVEKCSQSEVIVNNVRRKTTCRTMQKYSEYDGCLLYIL